MKHVRGWYIFVLNAYRIGLSFMWNSLHVNMVWNLLKLVRKINRLPFGSEKNPSPRAA
jgi:hypothetical protein